MLNRLGDMPLAVPPGEFVSQDGNQNFQSQDSSVSEDMRSALMKKVALEKRRTSSHKKVDLKRVSDPIGIPIPFACHSTYRGTRSIMWLILLSSLERKAKEWLYPYPDFITKRPPYNQMKEEYDGWEHRLEIDLQNHLDESLRMKFKGILTRGFKKWNQETAFSTGNYSAVVVDVGQHQRSSPNIEWCDAEDLDRHLKQARRIYDAKKRFQCVQMAQFTILSY